MTSILIATQNAGKLREFADLLSSHLKCLSPDVRAPQVDENGASYAENAFKKAKAFIDIYQLPVLSDDSGLEIDVLKGAPGLYSARFGGEEISWTDRFQKLYQLLAPYPESQWTARFRCVLCLLIPDEKPIYFEGVCEGKILQKPQGEKGFGYDPLFFSQDLGKAFGVASLSEKAQVSHRAKAIRAFLDWFLKNPRKLSLDRPLARR